MIRFWPTLILFLLISVFRFYTFCLPVRCCRAFVAAGPTTSGMKWTTMGEWQDLYSRRRTPDVGIYTQPLPCYLTSNQFFVSTKHSDFIPDRLYRKVFWGSKTDATLVYLSFYQVLDACTTFFWGGGQVILLEKPALWLRRRRRDDLPVVLRARALLLTVLNVNLSPVSLPWWWGLGA